MPESVKQGDKRQIARLISRIENGDPAREEILEALVPHTGRAHLIGVTGPPGAGKSTLLDALIRELRKRGKTVGVIAVDPTSPFTGGAILGDRVRMTGHALDPGVFIRSMGSRGHLGGLSGAAREAVMVLDAAGYDVILIETVGVGQAELDIMHLADTVVLVLNPTAGDVVQVFKAGIMEIADLFVINKADLPGTKRLRAEIEDLLDLSKHDADWRPPIIETVATRDEGISDWYEKLEEHREFQVASGEWDRRRRLRLENEVRQRMEEEFRKRLEEIWADPKFQEDLQSVARRLKKPGEVAVEWMKRTLRGQSGR
ncbi:methylmalonyl Co-A mutase-associated GTPase MeaB [Staphylospora marina]|uniref:methylmalonyl Co-A mutase-associated GTPase MeaB n=1 Tax=Staphylospora marina TaxID=2490858 RepID=UPI000F5BAE15|nr:methylmalonyl Co-A mutase-associated GTPase MeaB [Staphylospora marina]